MQSRTGRLMWGGCLMSHPNSKAEAAIKTIEADRPLSWNLPSWMTGPVLAAIELVYGGAWNNNGVLRKLLPVVFLLLVQGLVLFADEMPAGPRLLLNAQRLRRLKRDRERKTARWVAFENRVMTVPDSPERGFELALYYAITGDEAKGREAVEWAVGHARLSALVLDWCGPVVSAEQKRKLSEVGVTMGVGRASVFARERDAWFHQLVFGDSVTGSSRSRYKDGRSCSRSLSQRR